MPQKKTSGRVCENPSCLKAFFARPVDVAKGYARFCSNSCASKIARRPPPPGSGSDNPRWNGGKTKSTKGYWYTWKPDHPKANKHGYVKRANLVLEEKLGRYLNKGEIAHHENEDKEDDSPGNLELMMTGAHAKLHAALRAKLWPPKSQAPKQPDHPVNRRYQWPPDEQLLVMRSTMTLREIAAQIGCSFKAVDRRVKRIPNKA